MSKDPIVYLEHILERVTRILEFTSGTDENAFLADAQLQDAVIRNFEVIGEATKQLPTELTQRYPDIEWKKMAGMRDKLIHDYIDVDLWAVWDTVQNVLPVFKLQLERIIEAERNRK